MTPPLDIPSKEESSGYDAVGSFARSFPRSFRSVSEIANEALRRDLAECSDDGDVESPASFLSSEDEDDDGEVHHTPALYRRPEGVAFGVPHPIIVPVPRTHDEPVLTRVEKLQSRAAERSLLRDNHFLPPKHPLSENPSVLSRIYKKLFSTKVRGKPYDNLDEEAPACETTPLLKTVSLPKPGHEHLNGQWNAAVAAGQIKTTWQREVLTIVRYSRSLILTFLLHYSVTVASIAVAGSLGTIELGAVSLAIMTANVTMYMPFQGAVTALDTLCAQAYGSGHKHLVGLQVQRMSYFLLVLTVPVSVVWWYAEDILLLMIPEPQTCRLAGLYMKVLILGAPGVFAFECGKRFVQAQALFHATTYTLLAGAPVSIFLNWFLVKRLDWGFVGAPIAHSVTQLLLPVLLFLYVVLVEGRECWGGLTKRAFHNWGPMIRLAVPGMIMVEAEFFAFEILTMVTPHLGATVELGSDYLAAQSAIVTLTSILYQIPFPLAIAAGTRVANLIGANVVDAARTSAKVAVVSAVAIGLVNFTILTSGRYYLPGFFSDNDEVVSMAADVLPICAVLQLLEALASMSHGLLRAIGRQSVGGYTNLLVYYSVALPVSFGTAFYLDWELQGLWFGVTVGIFLVALIEYWFIHRSDWNQAAKEAASRNESW